MHYIAIRPLSSDITEGCKIIMLYNIISFYCTFAICVCRIAIRSFVKMC